MLIWDSESYIYISYNILFRNRHWPIAGNVFLWHCAKYMYLYTLYDKKIITFHFSSALISSWSWYQTSILPVLWLIYQFIGLIRDLIWKRHNDNLYLWIINHVITLFSQIADHVIKFISDLWQTGMWFSLVYSTNKTDWYSIQLNLVVSKQKGLVIFLWNITIRVY